MKLNKKSKRILLRTKLDYDRDRLSQHLYILKNIHKLLPETSIIDITYVVSNILELYSDDEANSIVVGAYERAIVANKKGIGHSILLTALYSEASLCTPTSKKLQRATKRLTRNWREDEFKPYSCSKSTFKALMKDYSKLIKKRITAIVEKDMIVSEDRVYNLSAQVYLTVVYNAQLVYFNHTEMFGFDKNERGDDGFDLEEIIPIRSLKRESFKQLKDNLIVAYEEYMSEWGVVHLKGLIRTIKGDIDDLLIEAMTSAYGEFDIEHAVAERLDAIKVDGVRLEIANQHLHGEIYESMIFIFSMLVNMHSINTLLNMDYNDIDDDHVADVLSDLLMLSDDLNHLYGVGGFVMSDNAMLPIY